MDDALLLHAYARDRDPSAFATLVRRHTDLVYSAALRRMNGDPHDAQEITQRVFLALERNAGTLVKHPALPAWLHRCTRNAVIDLQREKKRRLTRETAAAHAASLNQEDSSGPTADWTTLAPVLDAALDTLGETDRQTIVLRYFAQHPFADIAARLHTTEAAAQMRATRALEKLRRALQKRGVTSLSTAAVLGLALGTNSVSAAPASVATSTLAALGTLGTTTATAAALATSAGTGATLFSLTMTTSTKLTLGVTAALLLAVGAGSGIMAERHLFNRKAASAAAFANPPRSASTVAPESNVSPSILARHAEEVEALKKQLAAKDARLAEQAALLAKHAATQKENDKRRVFRDLDELGKYTAEVSLRFLNMMARYKNVRVRPGSPEEAALQAEIAQITQDSAVLLEDPLFTDEMKSGDPARMAALQLSYIGEILKFTPAQKEAFHRAVTDGYRAAYDQKLEWAMTDPRLHQLNQDAVRAVKAELTAEQISIWEQARLNKLLFNFSVGTP